MGENEAVLNSCHELVEDFPLSGLVHITYVVKKMFFPLSLYTVLYCYFLFCFVVVVFILNTSIHIKLQKPLSSAGCAKFFFGLVTIAMFTWKQKVRGTISSSALTSDKSDKSAHVKMLLF